MAKSKKKLNKTNSSGWLDDYSEKSVINKYADGDKVVDPLLSPGQLAQLNKLKELSKKLPKNEEILLKQMQNKRAQDKLSVSKEKTTANKLKKLVREPVTTLADQTEYNNFDLLFGIPGRVGTGIYSTAGNLLTPSTYPTLGKGAVNLVSNALTDKNVYEGVNEDASRILGEGLDILDVMDMGVALKSLPYLNKLNKYLPNTKQQFLNNAYNYNPWANKTIPWEKTVENANKSFRVAGLDALEDFQNTGVLRSRRILPENATLADRVKARTTEFPSFQQGYADLDYLPEEGGVIFETSLPTFKRGELNPVTGNPIKGRHYAHRVIDPKTGKVLTEIPSSEIKAYKNLPHWRKGYVPINRNGGEINQYADGGLLPKAQYGFINPSITLNLVPALYNKFLGKNNPVKANVKNLSKSFVQEIPSTIKPTYESMREDYLQKMRNFNINLSTNDSTNYDMSNAINLTSGRFKGAAVSPELINEAVQSAKAKGIDPWLMLSVIGRESTFGSGDIANVVRKKSKRDLLSGWNVSEPYEPYDPLRFFADKKAPGINVGKSAHGWFYDVNDETALNKYLTQHPELVAQYQQKISATPLLGDLDSFDLAAKMIKEKGLKNYNAGDPKYLSMVNQDMQLLKSDSKLKEYMKKLGYKNGGEINQYIDGGKVNAPIYVDNPNDPRLRKYQDSLDVYNKTSYDYNRIKNKKLASDDTPINLDSENRQSYEIWKREYSQPAKKFAVFNSGTNQNMLPKEVAHFRGNGWNFLDYVDQALFEKPVQPVVLNQNKTTVNTTKGKVSGKVIPNNVKGSKLIQVRKEIKPENTNFTVPNNGGYSTPEDYVNTNFEQRIQNPVNKINNEDGSHSTHKMMSFEADGKFYAAPTIIEKNGKLIELDSNDAIDYALKNKEYKEFATESEAQKYAEGDYKKGTALENKQDYGQYMQPKGFSRKGRSGERPSESFYNAKGKLTGQIIGGQYVPTEYGKFLQSGMTEDEYLNQIQEFAGGGKVNDNNGYLISNLDNFTPKKIINSNYITTNNMAFPVEANGVVLYPNTGNYVFPTDKVTEIPIMQNGSSINNDMKKKLKKYQGGGYLNYQDSYKGFGVGPQLYQDNSYFRSVMPDTIENMEEEINKPSVFSGINDVLGAVNQGVSQVTGLMSQFSQPTMGGNNVMPDISNWKSPGTAPKTDEQLNFENSDAFLNWQNDQKLKQAGLYDSLYPTIGPSMDSSTWKGVPFIKNGGYLRKYQNGGNMDMLPVGYPEYIHKSNVFHENYNPVPRVHFSDDTTPYDMGVNLNDLVNMYGGRVGKYQYGGMMPFYSRQRSPRVFNSNANRASAADLDAAYANDFMHTKVRKDRQSHEDDKVDWGFMDWAKDPVAGYLGMMSTVPIVGDITKDIVGDSFLTRRSGYAIGKGIGNVSTGAAKVIGGVATGNVGMIGSGVGDLGEGVGSTIGTLQAKDSLANYDKSGYVSGNRMVNASQDFGNMMDTASSLYGNVSGGISQMKNLGGLKGMMGNMKGGETGMKGFGNIMGKITGFGQDGGYIDYNFNNIEEYKYGGKVSQKINKKQNKTGWLDQL